jgi:hypothetical protein
MKDNLQGYAEVGSSVQAGDESMFPRTRPKSYLSDNHHFGRVVLNSIPNASVPPTRLGGPSFFDFHFQLFS